MASFRALRAPELIGVPLVGWGAMGRVTLPGGGFMYVPTTLISTAHQKDHLQKYVWRGEHDEGSIGVELIAYHRAMRLTRTHFSDLIAERAEKTGGSMIGQIESLIVGGYEALYGCAHLDGGAHPATASFGAYARILMRDAGLLFEATHADRHGVDLLARAILATIVF